MGRNVHKLNNGYVRNADVTIEHIRRLVKRLGYIELPSDAIQGNYVIVVMTPEQDILGYTSLTAARTGLSGRLGKAGPSQEYVQRHLDALNKAYRRFKALQETLEACPTLLAIYAAKGGEAARTAFEREIAEYCLEREAARQRYLDEWVWLLEHACKAGSTYLVYLHTTGDHILWPCEATSDQEPAQNHLPSGMRETNDH